MSGYLESAITSLSKPKIYLEKERLLKILRFIWKQIKSAKQNEVLKQLQRGGCFKHLVNVLQNFANIEQTKLNVAIVITVISILGYSFQDRAIATEVIRQTLLLQVINRLLKHYKLNEVQNKIFRIICITCQHWNRLANTIIEREPAIIVEIVAFVNNYSLEKHRSSQIDDDKTDKTCLNATVMQALSALRCLLNGNTVVPLIKDFGVLKAIGSLLIKYHKEWERTKEHEETLRCIIKLLSVYSKYHYKSSINELKTTNKGCALEHLRKLVILYPQGVAYITLNLSHVMVHKSDLCVTETAQILINQLQNPGDILGGKEGSLYREYLKSLILLLSHGCFRADIFKAGALDHLIEIARECNILKMSEVKICGIIIKALANLPFDYPMMVELIQKGMVKVLAEKLSVVGKDSCLADRRVEGSAGCNGKRCLSIPIESIRTKRMCLREPSPPMIREESFDDVIDIRSSSPSSTTSFLSPPSSPSCSNGVLGYSYSNEPDSDTNYSPVCSDDEKEADAESATDNPTESSDSSLDQAPESTMPDTSGSSEEADFKKALVDDSIRLLNHMSIPPDFAKDASYAEALSTLMLFRFDMDIYTIIYRAFKYPGASFLKLMQTDFVLKLYEYTTKKMKSDCAICLNQNYLVTELLNHLNSHIEVCGGKGDLAHLLLRGNPDIKKKLVPSIPLVTKNKAVLNKLMVTCGGLEVLLNVLIEERSMLERIVKGLNVLAQEIGIKHPVSKIKKKILSCEGGLNTSKSVTFLMDDGTEVSGNRDVLIQRSQYFEKLLSGHFKEATEEQIRISNVSATTFKHLLQLLSSTLDVATVISLDLTLDLLLDLIVLTDRYLIEDYCLCLTLAVQDYKLTSDSAVTIYRWSLESCTNLLRIEVVVYALVAGMVHSERVRVFEDLLDGGCVEYLVEDLRTLFARFLNLGISYA